MAKSRTNPQDPKMREDITRPSQPTAKEDVDAAHAATDDVTSRHATPSNEVTALRAELEEAQNRVLRAQAELDNYRKRMRRDMDEERRFACLPLMRDLLPVLDNFKRALSTVPSEEASGSFVEGIRMVGQQLTAVLEQHHCEQIVAEQGIAFDPNHHEAIAQQESAAHPAGTIIDEQQTGYRLHDRVIRPAHVIVSKGDGEQ